MITIQMCSYQPVSCCSNYKGIAFDGCYFYFTNPECCEVHKYDCCFQNMECISVCRGYTSLCFDRFCTCFWALSCKEPSVIFKLDCCLREIDRIKVKYGDFSFGSIQSGLHAIQPYICGNISITGVACYEKNKLLICGNFGIATIFKSENSPLEVIEKAETGVVYSAIESIDQEFIIKARLHSQEITLNEFYSSEILQLCLPKEYSIEDFTQCQCFNDCYFICILTTKQGCYPYLIWCKICCAEECLCPPWCQSSPLPHHENCRESASSIIESIALIEASLSNILNAEGEKIEKIICCTDEPCEIIEVNKSVNKTITSITNLEHVLYYKLQIAQELCCSKDCNPNCFDKSNKNTSSCQD